MVEGGHHLRTPPAQPSPPSQVTYGVFVADISDKIDVITKFNCAKKWLQQNQKVTPSFHMQQDGKLHN